MRQHAEYGFHLLQAERELEPEVLEAIHSHHERPDGTGYPRALPAAQIGKFTRIITIVDAYDSMTSDSDHRKGMSTSEALRVLYNNRGDQFDESLVTEFIRMIGIYPPGSLVELNSGEIAVILSASPDQKLLPVVELVLDSDGNRCPFVALNLSRGPVTTGGEPYAIVRSLPDGYGGFSLQEHIGRLNAEHIDAASSH